MSGAIESATDDAACLPQGARLLAVIDPNERGAAVARQAWQLAMAHGGSVVVATVVDDAPPGFETDHWPFLPPDEREARSMALVRQQLRQLMVRHHLDGLQQRVVVGQPRQAVADLTVRLRSDAVIVGRSAWLALDATAVGCAVVVVPTPSWIEAYIVRPLSMVLSSLRLAPATVPSVAFRPFHPPHLLGQKCPGGLELTGLGEGLGGKNPRQPTSSLATHGLAHNRILHQGRNDDAMLLKHHPCHAPDPWSSWRARHRK
ncbi:MAG: hypothetical protein FD149_522 [Rhodospirillaceae bacterium]|nr:MAG: hypothetical protein FD149_522 [Rhodospirillaceae bacterium]